MSTIPSLALIPSGVKASKVYSVLPTDGSGDFDFTRSGNATRVNSDGLIELVSTNVPRLNYPLIDGVVSGCPSLLLEPSRTNLIPYSEEFDNAWWENSAGVIPNTAVSPNGTLSADTNSSIGIYPASAGVGDATIVNTASIFAKLNPNGASTLSFTLNRYGSGDAIVCTFDLLLGTAGVAVNSGTASGGIAKIDNYGNGWYRCSITGIASTTAGSLSFSPSNNCFIWGAQLEVGSYPTSYIPTTTNIATRSAETCNNAGDVNTFNDSEGVLFAEISAFNDTTVKAITIGDGTSSNRIQLFYFNGASIYGTCIVGGVSQASLFTNIDVSTNIKVAFKYKVNDFALWVNGFEVGIDTNGTVPTGLNTLRFDSGVGTSNLYGNTKQLQYFDTALTDLELQQLTTL
jgi:hypothetical protein